MGKKTQKIAHRKFIRTKPLIRLQNVWKVYQLDAIQVPALRGLSLEIFPGDFVAIMGPSGSGKSTLMNLIGCLDLPTKGHIFLEDHDISKLSESRLAQIRGKKIGFVFQQFNLLHNLSALENVTLPMTFQNVPEKERKERARKLLGSVGLKERMNHRPNELSGGEQQRVAIARALANDPDIIIADEPTGNLDSTSGKQVMELLIDLHKNKNKTIVVVTHDPYVAGYSERTFNIQDGQLIHNHILAKKFLWAENRRVKHAK